MKATAQQAAIVVARRRLQAAWAGVSEVTGTSRVTSATNPTPSPSLLGSVRLQTALIESFVSEMKPPGGKPTKLLTTGTGGADFQQPEELRSKDGVLSVTLRVVMAHNLIGGVPVFLRSYNGKLTGPTLRAHPGDTLRIALENDLDPEVDVPDSSMNTLHSYNTTNLHTHGLHVSPAGISDNVLLEVYPHSVQNYEILIPPNHPCGTFWYHAHRHGSTAAQVGSGMSGALIIEGGMDTVPEISKAKERVMVLQQIVYDAFVDNPDPTKPRIPVREGIVEPQNADLTFGPATWDHLKDHFTTINGLKQPVIRMRPGSLERWRLIDSALREEILLSLVKTGTSAPNAPATLKLNEIAEDGLPLGKVSPHDQIDLWPGYRSERPGAGPGHSRRRIYPL